MKVITHAGVDSRMIILDDQARQEMTHHIVYQSFLFHLIGRMFVMHMHAILTIHCPLD